MTLERRRRPGAVSDATEAPVESFEPTQPTLEYVTIRRDRDRTPIPPSPSDTPLSPTSPVEEPQQTRLAQGPTTPRYRRLVFQRRPSGASVEYAFPSLLGARFGWRSAECDALLSFPRLLPLPLRGLRLFSFLFRLSNYLLLINVFLVLFLFFLCVD